MEPQIYSPDLKFEIFESSFDRLHDKREEYFAFLSKIELKSLQEALSKQRADEILYGRGMLREILGKKLQIEPHLVCIELNAFSKPELSSSHHPRFYFNLSHSRDVLAIGMSPQFPIGIDVEVLDGEIDFESLAPIFMSPREYEGWKKTKSASSFYRLFTQKEACLKCEGKGFFQNPSEYDIQTDFISGHRGGVKSFERKSGENTSYMLSYACKI